jgi:hypothetical protein
VAHHGLQGHNRRVAARTVGLPMIYPLFEAATRTAVTPSLPGWARRR